MSESRLVQDDWVETQLGGHAVLQGGFGFPEVLQGRTDGAIPFFKVSDMTRPGNDVELRHAKNYVSRALAVQRGWKLFPTNTVVFAKVGAALLLNRRRILSQP